MTATALVNPKARFFDANGAPLVGGKLYAYVGGTVSTPQDTYTTQAGNVANTNPVVLDANGEANIWLSGNYKLVLKNSAGVQQWAIDNVQDYAVASAFMKTVLDDTTAAAAAATLGVLALTGGTLTGDLTISESSPTLTIRDTDAAGGFVMSQDDSGNVYLNNTASAQLNLATNNSTKMSISSAGDIVIGGAVSTTNAILDVQSTTKSVKFCSMTTTQKNAISSPSAGMLVFDATLGAYQVYNGSSWGYAVPTRATAQSSPSDPTGTASTIGVMMGLAGAITPTATGKILILISGDAQNTNGGDVSSMQIRYGTGTAPANAAALTGTTAGGLVKAAGIAAKGTPFSLNAIVSGLSVGTAYWVDISLTASANTSAAKDISISILEQ